MKGKSYVRKVGIVSLIAVLVIGMSVNPAASANNNRLFDFETGDFSNWDSSTGWQITNNSIEGSYSAEHPNNGNIEKLGTQQLANAPHDNFSFVFSITQYDTGYPRLAVDSDTNDYADILYIDSSGNLMSESHGDTGIDISLDTVYEIRYDNLDYTNSNYDLVVRYGNNGTEVGNVTNIPFYSAGVTELGAFDFNSPGNGVAKVDYVRFNDSKFGKNEYEVSGVVKDSSDNTRIEGATVEAIQDGSVVKSTTTNANGEYSLNVTEGTYTFKANKDKYEAESFTQTVSGGVIYDFSLSRIIIEGQVVDTTGSGLADAKVEVIDGFGNVVTSATTDTGGNYSVWVANGTYDFNASKSGYTNDSITYNVAGSGTINDHTLESKGLVDGYVTDLNDKRIKNATVTIYENGTKVDSMLTTKNGNFSFNVTNGDYRVDVDKHQYHSYSENFTVNGGYSLGKIQIEAREYDLTMQVSPYMNYTDVQEVVVRFNDEDVTENVTITLSGTNASKILTYHTSNNSLVATGNMSYYGSINVNASYNGSRTDKIVYVDENVTVAPLTIEHVEILSPLYMTITIIDNQPMQYVFIVIVVGVGAAILTTRSGGMGLMLISLIGGWIAGFIGLGVVLASLFAGMFIMLNTQDRMRYGR